ncbi:group 1 truncated hemoglobin [Owenweeksia hongkongensis]|uniref:group 1 truncated hemoglobin n=1 Tax=Owenweeksia hongkongensis TaxID=253245 RepID=UPI003A8DB97F
MKMLSKFGVLLLVGSIGFMSSCKDDDKDDDMTPTPEPTLYEKVGGTEMVSDPANAGAMIEKGRLSFRAVVDSTIFVIAGDTVLQPFFPVLLGEVQNNDLSGFAVLSKNLTDFFSVAAGAENYTYSGMNMVDAHDPAKNSRMAMKSDDAAFDAFVADVVIGAQQNDVPNDIIAEVGELLETLRDDVVQK